MSIIMDRISKYQDEFDEILEQESAAVKATFSSMNVHMHREVTFEAVSTLLLKYMPEGPSDHEAFIIETNEVLLRATVLMKNYLEDILNMSIEEHNKTRR